MQPIHTLDDFFTRSGASVTLYHMGRRVTPCARNVLAQFEHENAAWPDPWQGKARLAIMFRLGDIAEPAIWFLALSLDELGQIDPAPRDAFLQRLLETLGHNVSQVGRNDTQQIDNLMKDNPLVFTPSLSFQAIMHARASHDLAQPASQHLELVEAYVSRQQELDWQALGLQGLADFVIHMDTAAEQQLAERLPSLPEPVLHSLCYCLEHVAPGETLMAALRVRGEQAAQAGDIETLCCCVRAVGGTDHPATGEWFDNLLADNAACGPDLLAAIAARGWEHLEDAERLPCFLECLAKEPRSDFSAVVRDLASIPRLRLPVVMCLRDAHASSATKAKLTELSAPSSRM
ncbi:DUF3549 family protein [Halomonas sediminis]